MNAVTVTLGTLGALLSVLCWLSFLGGVRGIVQGIRLGQPAPDRWRPFWPRLRNLLVEFLAHTRMHKFRTVGWAHWLVMIGFLGGFILWFESYGQTFDPTFHWPLFGDSAPYHLWDEILGIGTVLGILVLITIRQLNHPRVPERLSRFSGSAFGPAYVIEAIVLLEGLGMIFVKAGRIATYHHSNPATDFFTMRVAQMLPASVLAVSIFAFVKLMSGMAFLYLVGRNITWGVAWHRFSAFPNIYFKRDADGSPALGPLKPMTSQGKPVDLENADPDVDTFGAGKIEDFSWKGWLDFTTCTECGRCQSQCPAWNTGKPLSPKLLITSLRDHGAAKAPYLLAGDNTDKVSEAARVEAEKPLVGDSSVGGIIDPDVLWSCTTCGACVEQCPVDIEHVDHIVDMRRYQVMIESEFPSELTGLFKNLERNGNPWGQSATNRDTWLDELDFHVPVFGKDATSFAGYEYLFWVGCAGAFDDRAKKTTKAVAELLATAGVKYLVLGQGETCTGDPARRAGNEMLFQQLAEQNIDILDTLFSGLEERSSKKIVTTCAHCFNALGTEYPQLGANYEVVHHTQLLNRLVRGKQLVPVKPLSRQVTYHDPCYLGRHNKVYAAPRELLDASGSRLVEMPRHGERSMCCGAGGARMWMEERLGKRVNLDRIDEALSTEPTAIATGCPFCRVMLGDGLTTRQDSDKGTRVEVMDVAQVLLETVERREPAHLTADLTVTQTAPPTPEPSQQPAPEPEKTPEEPPRTPKTAPTGGGLAKKTTAKPPGKGLTPKTTAPAPGKGLGMKTKAKPPGSKTSASDTETAAKPAESPTQAAETSASTESSPSAAPKKPTPGKGLTMKGAAKAPGKSSRPQPSTPQPESSESVPPETAQPPAKPKPGALGFKSGTKPPGRKQ